jgi:hypothetical protein
MKPALPAASCPRDIDDLDRAIVSLSARINASTCELLVLIREFDERAGWLKWGFENCADWLHWRCDLSRNAAREKVRVAHALKALPAIARSFASGALSYSKVRALVRVANRENETELRNFALRSTAARVEERCRELRSGTGVSVEDANRAYARRSLFLRRDPRRGTVIFNGELPLEVGELLEKALDRARDDRISQGAEYAEESWSARQADGLLAIVKAFLAEDSGASAKSPDYQVTVHVDESALTHGKGRAGLPLESVKRIACDSDKIVVLESGNGEPMSVGRKTRVVPTHIKRALESRDKGCRFPGCKHTRFVDAHHIRHWSAGGETSLDNLVLLCTRHHRLVHEGGYRIEKDYLDRWMFKRPDGIAVPDCGYRPEDRVDECREPGINDLRRDSAESYWSRMETSYRTALLLPGTHQSAAVV